MAAMFSFLKTKKSAGVRITPAVHRLIARANAARDRDAWDEAADCYRAAIAADPALTHIWIQLGHAEKERHRSKEAEAAYARAAMLTPEKAEPLLHLGHIYKLTGNVPGATRAYLQAARLNPADPHAIEELQRFIAGTAPSARADLIALLRGALFNEDADKATRHAIQAAGDNAVLFDVSSLIAAAIAGRGFADLDIMGDRLVPALTGAGDRPAMMCAHVTGHGRWLAVGSAQFARIVALSRAPGTMGPNERQDAITDLDLSFLLSEPLEMPANALLVDLDAGHAPADHALFVRHARQAYGARYLACGDAVPATLAEQADGRIDRRGVDLTVDAVRAFIVDPIEPAPNKSIPEARPARLEALGGDGRAFRIGTGWLPPEDWGCWAAMPGGELEIALPAMSEPRLYLRLKALPSERTRFQVSLTDGRLISGEIESSQQKWVVIDDLPMSDNVLRLRIRGDRSKLVHIQNQARKLPAMIGVVGFYLCEREDRAARLALLETTTFGNLESLS